MKNAIKVTVIIPAKDEELTIAACIESVIAALKKIDSSEIILVDSCSSDRTVDIAKEYPISIFRLRDDWIKSPAAGRYIGSIKSRGEYLSFIDADMIVEEGWIVQGVKYLDEDSMLAGISGELFNVVLSGDSKKERRVINQIGLVDYLPGAAIFRKSVIEEAGHFNPFMMGNEEKELGERIKKLGYKQLRIESKIATHFSKEKSKDEVEEKAKYFIGVAQYFKLNFSANSLKSIVKKYPLAMAANFLAVYFFFALAAFVFFGNVYLIAFFFTAVFLLTGLLALKQRNLQKTFLFLYGILSKSAAFFYGFLHSTKSPKEYPSEAEQIQ
jgi:glycosyltransferase involved in cell wall biosynthesis